MQDGQSVEHVAASRGAEPAEGVEQASSRAVAPRLFSALQYPNYRLWFMGQLVSLVGTWMQITAQGFLVFELTRSPAYLGYVGFAAGVPSLLFMLVGGVVADRVERRTLLMVTQAAMMGLAFVLAMLTFSGLVRPWHIVLLALALGTANAFDAPARQAFVFELVDRKDTTNAIALNASLFNLGSVVGPAVAGLAYASLGAASSFMLNALSFVAVLLALGRMRLPARAVQPRRLSAISQLRDGVCHVLSHRILRLLIAIPALLALVGTGYGTLLPAWAVAVLGGDATTNGLLQAARGIGSLLGVLVIAGRGPGLRRGSWFAAGLMLYPITLFLFAGSRQLLFAMGALAAIGLSHMIIFNLANTLVQSHVADEYRGRVMSLYSLTFFGMMPLGALATGALAEGLGAPLTVGVSAVASLLIAAAGWFLAPQLRRLQ